MVRRGNDRGFLATSKGKERTDPHARAPMKSSNKFVAAIALGTTILLAVSNLRYSRPNLPVSISSGDGAANGNADAGASLRSFYSLPGLGAKEKAILSPALFQQGGLLDGGSGKHCLQWAVVSESQSDATVRAPNASILKVSNLRDWCLVVVGDHNSDKDNAKDNANADLAAEKDNVFYLSALQQMKLGLNADGDAFARKNIGYLFALSHGAKVLFDFDDDNVLTALEGGVGVPPPFLFSEDSGFDRTLLLNFIGTEDYAKPNEGTQPAISNPLAFNPYIYMGAGQDYTWPRGFPLDMLPVNFHEWHTYKKTTTLGDIQLSSVGVIQSLCTGDPDHDLIYRTTRVPSEFTFDNSLKALPLLIPSQAYAPYNAQATTHLYHAFWGLYLPVTVHERMADVWRSYINQRIMKDIGLHVVYTPPIVNRHHSVHDHLPELIAENDLYLQTTKMLDFLDAWSSSAETLEKRILELWNALYTNHYIGAGDVHGIKEWLKALNAMDYKFPSVGKDGVAVPVPMPNANAPLTSQPFMEGQPYRAFPHFDKNVGGTGRPDKAVLKLIMITMNEWPVLKFWVMYHGDMIGFENLYIMDGSTDERCTSFLRYARDVLGANVIFTTANLNELQALFNEMAVNLAGSSDFIMKVDTDEYLFVGAIMDQSIATTVSGYLSGYGKDPDHPLQKLRRTNNILSVGYVLDSLSSEEVCNNDYYAPPDQFPMNDQITALGVKNGFKRVYDSTVPFVGNDEVNLGGHAVALPGTALVQTEFGMMHYHTRCIEIEVENSLRVCRSHGFIDKSMTDEEANVKLEELLGFPHDHEICTQEHLYTPNPVVSFHKAVFLVKYWKCPETMKSLYYAGGPGKKYLEVINAFKRSETKFGINDSTTTPTA
mmetsp:Transcript_2924/g.5149  ORF Transcript_2924/g.5149 Transcript_2924/m.5149 type:complete len:882 (-) Transcript_2924:90-2735(-)